VSCYIFEKNCEQNYALISQKQNIAVDIINNIFF
jgi:hypothetical protein